MKEALLLLLSACGSHAWVAPAVTTQSLFTVTSTTELGLERRSFLGGTAAVAGGGASALSPTNVVAPAQAAEAVSTGDKTPAPRIVLWGFGNQNQLMAQYCKQRNLNVVAVVGRHDIGTDYGLVKSENWGAIGQKMGVKIVSEEDAAAELAKTQPNVCLMATRSTITDLTPSLKACAEAKCNVITIAEELLDCRTSSPQLTNEMSNLFVKNGVSFTGSGFIDGACCEMTKLLSSMMVELKGFEGGLQYNVDDYGTVLAQAHGVGLTKSQFASFAKQPADKSYVYNSNEWLVSALGLTLKKTTEVRQPTFASAPVFSVSIDQTIPVGDATGMTVVATTTTKEGVVIVGKQVGKCYEDSDTDAVRWTFQGTPEGVSFGMEKPPTPEMTNTATLSRIPGILAAPPGYITSDRLPYGEYKS